MDEGSCNLIKECLESRGVSTTLALNYKEGLEKLFYEKPDIAILELIHTGVDSALINKIRDSDQYEIVDFEKGTFSRGLRPVLLLEGHKKTDILIDFLKSCLEKEESNLSLAELKGEGDLENFPYPNLLAKLYRDKYTGILTVSSRTKLKLYIINGIPSSAEGGDIETAVGRMLLSSGKIRKSDYEKAIEVAVKGKQKIGYIFVEMGLISPHELSSLLELQVKEKIIRGFSYTRGTYRLRAENSFIERIVAYQIKLPRILYEGVKRYVRIEDIEGLFLLKQGKNPSIEVISSLREETSNGGLGPKELRFVQLLKNGTGIGDIVTSSSLGRDETLKLLFFLYLIGYLKVPEAKDVAKDIKLYETAVDNKPPAAQETETERFDEEVIELQEVIETESDIYKEEPYQASFEEERVARNRIRKEKIEREIMGIMDRGKRKTTRETESELSKNTQTSGRDKKRTREERETLINEILKLYSTLDEKDFYQVLGVTKNSTKDEVKGAYFNLVKKFHPDANSDLGREVRHKSEEVFMKIAEAYEALSDDERRALYNTQLETSGIRSQVKELYEAELAYKKGELLLKQRSYQEAEDEFKKAVELNPNEAIYIAAFAWAAFLAASDKDKILDGVKNRLEKAISLNPGVADVYYYLGCIYKQINLKDDAEANFTKAIECNPNYLEAKRELWLLQKRKPEKDDDKGKKGKGFWSNLFKKE